jgi:DNA-binding transcriptional LysR family regulator
MPRTGLWKYGFPDYIVQLTEQSGLQMATAFPTSICWACWRKPAATPRPRAAWAFPRHSVSTRIGDLERAAGVPLVRRTTRSVGLTEAGLQLVSETQAAFERIEQSFAGVRDLAGSPRGLLRVTAPVALGRQHVAPTLAAFLQRYPEIRIELDLSDRFVNLAQEGFDLAIRHTQAPPETHVAWALCASRSLLVASPAYLRQHGMPDHPSQLVSHQCLLYLRDGGSQSWSFVREGMRKNAEQVVVPVNGPLRANNSEVLRDAVLGGLGLGLLPDFSAAAHLDPRRMVPVLARWRPQGFFGDRLYAIRPWAPQVPRAVQCMVDHLRECFRSGFELRMPE